MKLIRRTIFNKFTVIDTPIRAQYVKVIDTKTHRKVIVKNPQFIQSKWQQTTYNPTSMR